MGDIEVFNPADFQLQANLYCSVCPLDFYVSSRWAHQMDGFVGNLLGDN